MRGLSGSYIGILQEGFAVSGEAINKHSGVLDLNTPVITAKEARKLLGSKYNSIPDEMIELMISDMAVLASRLVDWQNGSTKSEGVV